SLQAGVQRDGIGLLLALTDARVRGRRVADVTVGGRAMPAIEADLAPAGRVVVAFDPVTGLMMYQRYGGADGDAATEETFSDYREVQGLQIAHHASVKREGQPPIQRIVRTFELNVPLEPGLFKKPVRLGHAFDFASAPQAR
ncbi:MAG: hypothetical protein WD227_06050, partial [Vicinamibacterales bacterium]